MARPVQKKLPIADAAIELFATKGLARTTTRDIAQKAGVAEGTLYRHWKNKDDMAWTLYCERLDAFLDSFRPTLFDETVPFTDRFTQLVQAIYEYYRIHNNEFAFILMTGRAFPEDRYPKQTPFELFAQALQKEMDAGRLAQNDPATLSAMVLGAVLQPVMHHRWGYSNTQPLQYCNQITQACIQMIFGFSESHSTDRSTS